MYVSGLFFKAAAISLFTLALWGQAASAQLIGCLHVEPDQCSGQTYKSENVINFYTPIYKALLSTTDNQLGVVSPESEACIGACSNTYLHNEAACSNLPTNDPTIGLSMQQVCLEVAEDAYRACLDRCMN